MKLLNNNSILAVSLEKINFAKSIELEKIVDIIEKHGKKDKKPQVTKYKITSRRVKLKNKKLVMI